MSILKSLKCILLDTCNKDDWKRVNHHNDKLGREIIAERMRERNVERRIPMRLFSYCIYLANNIFRGKKSTCSREHGSVEKACLQKLQYNKRQFVGACRFTATNSVPAKNPHKNPLLLHHHLSARRVYNMGIFNGDYTYKTIRIAPDTARGKPAAPSVIAAV